MGIITAKFGSVCSKCGNTIHAGDLINWTKGQPVSHQRCPAGEVEVSLTGEFLRTRLAALEQYRERLLSIVNDQVLSIVGERPHLTKCAACEGKGYTIRKVNHSDTLDFSDWRSHAVACVEGTALAGYTWFSDWTSDMSRWSQDIKSWYLAKAVPGEYGSVKPAEGEPVFPARYVESKFRNHYSSQSSAYAVPEHGVFPLNPRCVSDAAELDRYDGAWNRTFRRLTEENEVLRGVETLIRLTKADLVLRRDDVATVLNRGKEWQGKVIFIGPGYARPYSRVAPADRVTIITEDGTKKGGDWETAVFVSRNAKFPRS